MPCTQPTRSWEWPYSRSPCCMLLPRSNIIFGIRTTCCCACCHLQNRRNVHETIIEDCADVVLLGEHCAERRRKRSRRADLVRERRGAEPLGVRGYPSRRAVQGRVPQVHC